MDAVLDATQGRPLLAGETARRLALACVIALALTGMVAAVAQRVWPDPLGGAGGVVSGDTMAAFDAAQAGYAITSLSATNAAQNLSASFGADGAATIRSDGARFALGLTAFGRGSQLGQVVPAQPRVAGGTVRYSYSAGLTETWRNGPLGLEQGFVLTQPPAGSGPLTVALSAPAASVLAHGVVSLPGGLRYSGLRTTDARGRVLPSWFALERGRLLIKVSDRGAKYPVRIDPLVHQADLTVSGLAVGDYFGSSVAVSGHTLVAGAPYHKVGSVSGQGAVYVFSNSSGHWKQTAELTVAGGTENQYLGTSVAISGSTVVAGAPITGASHQGALYVFSDSSGHWKQVAELTTSDPTPGDELGGYPIAIQGKTIVAGTPAHTVGSVSEQGAVYVFNEPSSGWTSKTQSAELTEKHGIADDWVGWSVGISGGTIVAGAPADSGLYGHNSTGIVFSKRAGKWSETAVLHPKNPTYGTAYSVAVSGDTIAMGGGEEDGSLYVFQSSHGKWKQTANLNYNGICADDACGYAALGGSVAFTTGHVLLASASDGTHGYYVAGIGQYRQILGKWRQVGTVLAGANQRNKEETLAASIASSGDVVVAGLSNGVDKGSVAVFKGRVTSEGPLIGSIGSGAAGEAVVPVTCELAKSPCRVTIGVRRKGTKKVMGHAKPTTVRGAHIKNITVHFNKAFEHLLAKPSGVKVTFTVREYSHGKLKASGTTTVHFIAE
ncbi:MAG TPA: hypothetical protein VME70_14040 [Mycobacteriales bacterium]|nr:hypothetical protein [Mycobacteriales bacterium]